MVARRLGKWSITLLTVELTDFHGACRLFAEFEDKTWSLTDCTSYVLMQKHSIRKAFAFDEHFRQFGICEVLPSVASHDIVT
jgi:predicted nucleic acid-binding protein